VGSIAWWPIGGIDLDDQDTDTSLAQCTESTPRRREHNHAFGSFVSVIPRSVVGVVSSIGSSSPVTRDLQSGNGRDDGIYRLL